MRIVAGLLSVTAILCTAALGGADLATAQPDPGAISGTVTAADTAAPIQGICVDAYDVESNPLGFGFTDIDGNYMMTGIDEGDYFVRFVDCGFPFVYVTQWFDGQPDFASANPVTVVAGGTTVAVDAQMQAGGTISGLVTDMVSAEPVSDFCANAFDAAGSFAGMAFTGPDGSYAITALPAGNYRVHFSDCELLPQRYDSLWFDQKPDFESADPVAVVLGETTGGIDAQLAPMPACSGIAHDMAAAIAGPDTAVIGATCSGLAGHVGIFTDSLQGFPTDSGSFLALSTGVAMNIPLPPLLAAGAEDGRGSVSIQSHNPLVAVTFSVTVQVPEGATALLFDWKFGTDESFGSPFQDFFQADGLLVTVDDAFPISSCPPSPSDVSLACFVTDVQTHAIDVTGLSEYTLTFVIADDIDVIVDSAAFIDNLRFVFDAPPPVPGDVSGDGKLSMTDALLIAQCVAGLIDGLPQGAAEFEYACPPPDTASPGITGDVNGDGRVSMVDALLIARCVAGLIDGLPHGAAEFDILCPPPL